MNTVHRSRLFVPLATVAAAALLLSACGSSGGGSKASASDSTKSSAPARSAAAPSSPASSAPASSGAAAPGAPTKAQLQKIVLQPSDLPAGYKAAAADPDTGDDGEDAALAACTGVKGAAESSKVATAQSSDFSANNITISSEFTSYKSAGDVAADVAQLKSPKINQCLSSTLKASLSKSADAGTTVDGAAIKLLPGSNGGPSNVAGLATGVVDITANGQKAKIYIGVAFVTGPQLDGTLMYFGINTGPSQADQTKALNAVARRAMNP